MQIYTLPGNDRVYRYNEAVVVLFGGKRNVLSTAGHNGGYQEGLTAVFNHQSGYNYCKHPEDAPMPYEEYVRDLVEHKLGLSMETSAGMATIVSMENVCIETESYRDLTVTAIATASLEVNGGRVCDPAQYYEEKGKSVNIKPGTINIMLHVNADMSPGCMTRAIVTLTEAKTAAIQELLGSSLYSSGIATGSGSDSVIVISNAESDYHVTYAGKHGKLGEMIGITVKTAVKKALDRHMHLTPQSQHSMEKRTFRYGLTKETYWDTYIAGQKAAVHKADFVHRLELLDRDGHMVALTSLFIHLLDQLEWGMLSGEEAKAAADILLRAMADYMGIEENRQEDENGQKTALQEMTGHFARLMAAAGEQYKAEANGRKGENGPARG